MNKIKNEYLSISATRREQALNKIFSKFCVKIMVLVLTLVVLVLFVQPIGNFSGILQIFIVIMAFIFIVLKKIDTDKIVDGRKQPNFETMQKVIQLQSQLK